MKLSYRGASYEYNHSPLEVRESDILTHNRSTQQHCQTLQENCYALTYRGNRYTTNQVIAALSTPASYTPQELRYRGVKYIKNPVDGTTQLAIALQGEATPETTIAAVREVSSIHRDNLRRILERRLQAARERGDQSLVSLLEAESRELAS
ncbi:hypothetical protein OsccyDRAFT_1691 [Leptolyngbyaceae cyanobacterium JSC-12]|nr:hypothetical protein OsccyDRAFT_1691 [Leptolyngbyaceae cyanobacterium JSC-12]